MKIAALEVFPFRIPFRRPLRVGGTSLREHAGLLIRLRTADGLTGLGEASPHPPVKMEELCEPSLALVSNLLVAENSGSTASVEARASLPPSLRVALEQCALDLRARAAGLRLAAILGGVRRERVAVNALLDETDPGAAALEARRLAKGGFRCLKLKVGRDIESECRRLALVRDAIGGDVTLRADFNAAFELGEALKALEALASFRLEYVEQPVRDLAEMAHLRRAGAIPIAADESVSGVQAVDAIARMGAADVIVVKPARLGLAASRSVIDCALSHGLGVVITSNLDTSIGISSALHLAATLPDPARPCGLATLELLAGDLVTEPLIPREGSLPLPAGPGLGVELDEAALGRWKIS